MKQLADGLFQLRGFPPNAINVYLMGDVLVDAGTRRAGAPDPAPAPRARVSRTRADPCPPGPSGREQGGLRGARDPALVRRARRRTRWRPAISRRPTTGSTGCSTASGPVRRGTSTGLCVRGTRSPASRCSTFQGHSPGHVAFWRELDRVLVLGDVLNNVNVDHGRAWPARAEDDLHDDPARNRESARRLAALEPALACFGHGPPLRNPRKLSEFASRLP